MQLRHNEEELNRQFIEIYGLQDELTPDVPLDEITILQQGEISTVDDQLTWNANVVMKQLISYAIGCMMGRYSIDKPGLILANQGDGLEQYKALVPQSRFKVDDDGIVPLMPADCDFTDNASVRFKQWLSVTFGPGTLVENLNFIEKSLGKSIDDYFVKDFWKDHKKMYQNRPIYWLFSSKKGSFQCIAYMHRMNAYTAERIRTKYLLPHIEWLMQKQSEMEANAANLTTQERRQLDNIVKQIEECREYHDRLHVIADQQIAFDLDDGVVVNYAKFGDVLQKIK
jgi:tRNA-dihydrouridine synthase